MNAGTSAKSGRMTAKQIEMFGTRNDDTRTKKGRRILPCPACSGQAVRLPSLDGFEEWWVCSTCHAIGTLSRRTHG